MVVVALGLPLTIILQFLAVVDCFALVQTAEAPHIGSPHWQLPAFAAAHAGSHSANGGSRSMRLCSGNGLTQHASVLG